MKNCDIITKASKLFLGFTIVMLVVWLAPQAYNLAAMRSSASKFTIYSSIIVDFVTITRGSDGVVRTTIDGEREFTDREFDSIVPTFYVRQLVTDGRFPSHIHGVRVTPQSVQSNNFTFRSSPSDINKPTVKLFPLMESMSKRVELQMPTDLFRITAERGIEFIEMDTNTIDEQKSANFNAALDRYGFAAPAKRVVGNPSTKKDYDEGYLIIDSNDQLFHLKMTVGRPYVRKIALADGVVPTHAFVTEFTSRKTLGFVTDSEERLYVVTPDYRVRQIEVPYFNPEVNYMTIMGNMFNWTMRITSETEDGYYAIDSDDFSLIKSHVTANDYFGIPQLTLTSHLNKYVAPTIE